MHQKRRQQTYENLLDIKYILGNQDVFFWLQNGLLLGLYRDGDCIEGDENDLDIGIWYKDMGNFILSLPEFEKKGFRVRVTKTPYDGAVTVALKRKATKVHVHVNCEKDGIIFQPMNKKGGVFIFTKAIYTFFGAIQWQGEAFNCPNDIDLYLTERYGDWKTPILKSDGWDFYDNPKFNPCYREKLNEQ